MTPSNPRGKTRRKATVEDHEQVLVRAILKLPIRLRDVFLLHRMAGMTYSEIGLHLGMTPKAVETSLAAALVRVTRAAPPRGTHLREIRRRSNVHRGQQKPEIGHAMAPRIALVGMLPRKRRSENHAGSSPIEPDQRSAILTQPRGMFTISGEEFAV
jgi:hypothetical protein